MKNNTILVVYHSGKGDIKELMIKLVLLKISSEEKLGKVYNKNSHTTAILTGKQE